jgi:hypothetical protein
MVDDEGLTEEPLGSVISALEGRLRYEVPDGARYIEKEVSSGDLVFLCRNYDTYKTTFRIGKTDITLSDEDLVRYFLPEGSSEE